MIKKVIFLIVIVFVLSYLGQTLSEKIYSTDSVAFSDSLSLIENNLGFILLSQVIFYALEMIRFYLIGRAFNTTFTLKDNFGATSLNLLFGWLSPVAILGAPAMAYYLYKKGYPLAVSVTLPFVRSFSIVFVSAMTTVLIYGLKLQGEVKNPALQEKIFYVLTGIAIYIFAIVLLSFFPHRIIKNHKVLGKITSQVKLFLSDGKLYLLPILIMSFFTNFMMVSFIPYVCMNFYQDISLLISQTLLFLSYTLLMPTPGASGLAEIGAPMYFQGFIPIKEIVSTVTAMRISNISLQVLIGISCLFFLVKEKISFNDLKNFKKEN
jgi:uncharacterized membrane protein YbhN (UPF0104 family)